jgi:hypothetical protein
MGCGVSAYAEPVNPIGKMKSVRVEDVTGAGPFLIGRAPLPSQMHGLFWVSRQGDASCLASMGGPSHDGGGVSTGALSEDKEGGRATYPLRVSGDRTWAFADKDSTIGLAESLDLVYDFVYDSASDPRHAQIVPRAMGLGGVTSPEWLLDFEMELVPDGLPAYPGSVVWARSTKILGVGAGEGAHPNSNRAHAISHPAH